MARSLSFFSLVFWGLIKENLKITIDTEIKAKRNNMISELIPFRITKAKVKV